MVIISVAMLMGFPTWIHLSINPMAGLRVGLMSFGGFIATILIIIIGKTNPALLKQKTMFGGVGYLQRGGR